MNILLYKSYINLWNNKIKQKLQFVILRYVGITQLLYYIIIVKYVYPLKLCPTTYSY